MPTPAPRGGGGAITGEQRQVQYVARRLRVERNPAGGRRRADVTPQPHAAAERLLWLWAATPQGALKAAGATLAKPVADGAQIELTVGGRYPLHVHINKHEPGGSRSRLAAERRLRRHARRDDLLRLPELQRDSVPRAHPAVAGRLSDARPHRHRGRGQPVPRHHRARRGPQRRGAAAPTATSEKVADGVFWITGGSHHSLAVDMGDHVVVIEAPQNEARSELVIAETKKLIANKPIRMVVNTHLHFDHSGGLRRYVDEGATVVTHAANTAFFEKAWAGPRTLSARSADQVRQEADVPGRDRSHRAAAARTTGRSSCTCCRATRTTSRSSWPGCRPKRSCSSRT